MSVNQFVIDFRELLENLKSDGKDTLPTDNLIRYLKQVENSPSLDPSTYELEKYRHQLQSSINIETHQHNSDIEMFKSVIENGRAATKSLILINGGASVALLAFIGHLASFRPELIHNFAYSLLLFTAGVLGGAAIAGFSYLSQWLYASGQNVWEKVGFYINLLCIILGLSLYVVYGWAIYQAFVAFSALGS